MYRKYLILVMIFHVMFLTGQNKPNILWLVCEDQSLFFEAYGDSNAYTPNINQLANLGTVYENCFTVSPVCSPSRSSIITGMYPTSIGTQNMRAYKKDSKGNKNHLELPYYSPLPNREIKFFTEQLRLNGYYCTNNSKEDYNMMSSPLAWDESSKNAHWRNRDINQPFFSIFNFNITHESKIWKNNNNKNSINESVILPEIFPDNEDIKHDFQVNYSNIEKLDEKIGEIIYQLKEDNLFDSTIIFFFSDHGGPFPRYKRSIYDTGIQCPLIIKWINQDTANRNDQLISFVDFAPTLLDISNTESSHSMEGVSFYNKDLRKYIFAATDRFDESRDQRRCIRTKNYKLIFNMDTLSSISKEINYRKQMKTMQVLDSLNDNNLIEGYFKKWYLNKKDKYEFYDISKDPFEIENLYYDSSHINEIDKLKTQLNIWINSSEFCKMSETEMLNQMFKNDFSLRKLNPPEIIKSEKGLFIHPIENGVSVGYRQKGDKKWNIYNENMSLNFPAEIEILMFKPGYETYTNLIKYNIKE